MKLASGWVTWLGVLGAGIGLSAFGCYSMVINDYPSQGWGVGANSVATGGTGGGTTVGGGGNTGVGGEDCGAYPCYCYDCHGDPKNGNTAPPPDENGNLDVTVPTVGAHQAHLKSAPWHLALGCSQCHIVPVSAGIDPQIPTHLNGAVDIDWGSVAGAGVLVPDPYDTTGYTCGNTYCHAEYAAGAGGGPSAGAGALPVWNVVDGTHEECGVSCHLNPTPTINHPGLETDCERSGCHSAVLISYDTTNPGASLWRDPDLHINGDVDFD